MKKRSYRSYIDEDYRRLAHDWVLDIIIFNGSLILNSVTLQNYTHEIETSFFLKTIFYFKCVKKFTNRRFIFLVQKFDMMTDYVRLCYAFKLTIFFS